MKNQSYKLREGITHVMMYTRLVRFRWVTHENIFTEQASAILVQFKYTIKTSFLNNHGMILVVQRWLLVPVKDM
jgi:hypothetical protein